MTGPSRNLISRAAVALVAVCSAGVPALAQDQDYYLTLTGIRSATVAPGGLVFVSGAWTSRRDVTGSGGITDPFLLSDGSLSFGAGFGSAEESIGVQVTANITSLTDDFGDSGYLSLKLSRRISGEGQVPFYLGVTADRLAGWGDAEFVEESGDLTLTAFPAVRLGERVHPLMVTFGVGSHVRNLNSEPGAYFGVGLGVSRNLAVSAAWTGEDVTMGLGFRLDAVPNMHFSASVEDALDQNDSQRVTLQVTWASDKLFGGKF